MAKPSEDALFIHINHLLLFAWNISYRCASKQSKTFFVLFEMSVASARLFHHKEGEWTNIETKREAKNRYELQLNETLSILFSSTIIFLTLL